jgi:hypothetical protein
VATDAFGNPVATDAFGNALPTNAFGNTLPVDEFGNPIDEELADTLCSPTNPEESNALVPGCIF